MWLLVAKIRDFYPIMGPVCAPVRCNAVRNSARRHLGGVNHMATFEDRRAERDAKLEELHGKLTESVEQLISGEDWKRALSFAANFRNRSFNNTLLIWSQHQAAFELGLVTDPMPSFIAGYKQWQMLGRQVQKGQPGYQIFAPVTGRFASATPTIPESWRRLQKFEKPQHGEIVRSKMIGVRPAYVWDVSQTAGDPLPELPSPKLLVGEAPKGLWEGLAEQIKVAGFQLGDAPDAKSINGANGVTNYSDRTVLVRVDLDDAARVKTLAHELAHVLMHEPKSDSFSLHRGIGEVEAESVALMIGAAHGMDTSSYTIPYVASWASHADGRNPAEIVKATGERVRSTAVSILNQLDTQQLANGTPPGLEKDAPSSKVNEPDRLTQQRARTTPSASKQPIAVLADQRGLA